jgi:hypothetical protein
VGRGLAVCAAAGWAACPPIIKPMIFRHRCTTEIEAPSAVNLRGERFFDRLGKDQIRRRWKILLLFRFASGIRWAGS